MSKSIKIGNIEDFTSPSRDKACTKCGFIARVKCKSFLCEYKLCTFCKNTLKACPICNYGYVYIKF